MTINENEIPEVVLIPKPKEEKFAKPTTPEELQKNIKERISKLSGGYVLREKQLTELFNEGLDYASKMILSRYADKGKLKFFTISARKRVSAHINNLKIK